MKNSRLGFPIRYEIFYLSANLGDGRGKLGLRELRCDRDRLIEIPARIMNQLHVLALHWLLQVEN
jgi:hypothetical protein